MSDSANPSVDELLDIARGAAAAGAEVLAGRDPNAFHAENKSSDSDWVTAFDRDAENAVRNYILERRPNDEISGEEYGTSTPEHPTGYRWSIDPLDGTTNFIRNIAYYATSVAVADPADTWLAGVVHAPALGRVYSAGKGRGAWLEERFAGRAHTRGLSGTSGDGRGALLGFGLGYDAGQRARSVQMLTSRLENFGDVRRLGAASLDLCAVADGGLDAFAEQGLNEHDWSAGLLIADEAGCSVRRPGDGERATHFSDERRLNEWTVAARPSLFELLWPPAGT